MRITKGTNKYIKAGMGYTIGNYLLKGLSFFTIPIFARLLDTENYGLFNTFTSYESILYVLIGCAIHSSFKNARYKYKTVAEGSDEGLDYPTYVSNSYFFLCICFVIWLIAVATFSSQFSLIINLNKVCLLLLVIESFTSAVIICYNSDLSIQYSYHKFIAVAAFNAVGNILLSIILIKTVFKDSPYLGRIIGVVCPMIISSTYILVKQFSKRTPKNFLQMMRWGLRYSLPIVPHGISQVVLNSFDRIMIQRMISSSAAGLYSFAYNVYSIIAVTSTSLDTVWGPWFYEKKNKGADQSIKKYSSLYVIFLMTMCSSVMCLSPEIIKILGTKAYYDSRYCVVPIVAGGYFAFLYNLPAAVEYYYEKTTYIASATSCAAILNIVLNYFAIRKIGYIGAAYTTLITYLLYFVFHFFIAKKIEGKNLFDTKVLILCSSWVLLLTLLLVKTINVLPLRLALVCAMLMIVIIYEEHTVGFLQKKLNGKRGKNG